MYKCNLKLTYICLYVYTQRHICISLMLNWSSSFCQVNGELIFIIIIFYLSVAFMCMYNGACAIACMQSQRTPLGNQFNISIFWLLA